MAKDPTKGATETGVEAGRDDYARWPDPVRVLDDATHALIFEIPPGDTSRNKQVHGQLRDRSVYVENYRLSSGSVPQIAVIRFGTRDIEFRSLPFVLEPGENLNIEVWEADHLFIRIDPAVAPGTRAEYAVVSSSMGLVTR